MVPQTQPRKRRNSQKVNLLISFTFHAAIVLALAYFAAREGLLGKQLKKIAVEMVKEKPPEKPKEPEKPKTEPPKVEPPKVEQPKVATAPKTEAPRNAAPPPSSTVAAPPPAAPPAADVPSFVFEGGKAVESVSDPVQLYKGFVEYALRSKWDRPADIADKEFVAEVEVSVDRTGRVSGPDWKKTSGNARWDASVRAALAATTSISRQPPINFPPRVLVRFDVQEVTDAFAPMSLKKTTRRGHGTLNELNITPLLDLVFVLLVIFIITTPQMMNNLEMFLPSGKPPPPANPAAPKPKPNQIVIDDKGQVFLNDALVTVPALKQTLQQMKTADPELGVVVKGSDDVDYQHMVSVLDVLQQLEITKVGLATDAASTP